MLARSAEGLYWLGRHVERTENLCRLLREQMGALVDRPVQEINFGWRRIYGTVQRRPPGPALGETEADDDYALADSYTLADDLTFERSNPGSILTSFSNGRENARQMRHCISAEMWTCLNLAWLRLGTRHIEDIWKAAPEEFYADLAREMNLFAGVVDTTLYRDDGWRFLQLGRVMERAQFTITLLLAHLVGVQSQEEASDSGWSSLLRVCLAFDTYKRRYGVEMRPGRVLDLLVDDSRLPRSLCRAVDAAAETLAAISLGPGPSGAARRLAGDVTATIHRPSPGVTRLEDHADRLRRLAGDCLELHDLVMAAHVSYDPDGAPVR
jgi:uncharacterized alpha-E superfamily protein